MKKNEFKKVYDNGIKSFGRYITIYHLLMQNESSNLGVSISKKIGNACKRNYFKRVFREIFKKNKIYFNIINMILLLM
ncbi:ribonuclease P protein component [Candidatus Desantisbacteria bacterium]|nr:ribonuclease P protein component [Candidatus Desantisbacteria bacterium]